MSASREAGHKPVALISMPTLSGRFPSFQLALLKPTLERAGVTCQTFSLFMYFGAHVGWKLNEALADVWPCMVGEWIWSTAAHGQTPSARFGDDEAYRERFASNFEQIAQRTGVTFEELLEVKHHRVFTFLDWCVHSVDWSRFSAIGLSCVFQQNLASLALAKRLKAAHPDIPILFGGAGFEDDIAEELFAQSPFIDYLHCGDADETFPAITQRLQRGESAAGMKGLWWRDGDRPVFEGRAPNLDDLSTTPVPDFDEYFYAQAQTGYDTFAGTTEVMLPIETARGCWWGMKNHCTFCGLNRQGMAFRSKPADQVLEMVDTLATRYRQHTFGAIDIIVDPTYTEALFGKIADLRADLRFHYEVRPTLSRQKLKRMREGGLYSVQPGVESLNTHVLQLMNKRSTGMRMVEFLKWCTYYGIHNLYNILLRFPGETKADYDEQVETIAKIPHYQAPKFIVKARADRGSPMFTAPELHQISGLKPAACYPFLYPEEQYALRKVSYYFDHRAGGVCDDDDYAPLFAAVARWQALWKRHASRPRMTYRKAVGSLIIDDGRVPGQRNRVTLEGRAARMYELLIDAMLPEKLATALGPPSNDADHAAGGALEPAVQGAALSDRDHDTLHELVARDLVLHIDGRFLALALPENRHH